MSITYDGVNKYFDIGENCNVADMIAAKGGAPASDEMAYIFNVGKLSLEQNLILKGIYLGDNYAGNAAVKTGYIERLPGGADTLTLHDSATHGAFLGEGTTSKVNFIGTEAAPFRVICEGGVITCYNHANFTNYFEHVKFEKIYFFFPGPAFTCLHVTLKNIRYQGLYCNYLPAVNYGWVLDTPGAFVRVGAYSNFTHAQMNRLFKKFKVIAAAAGSNRHFDISEISGNNHIRMLMSAAPIVEKARHFGGGIG